MTVAKLRMLLVLLAGIAGSTVAQAQTPAALIYDPRVGAINFGAGDLKAALQQNGYSVSDLPLGDPSGATQSVRIILTTSDAGVPGKPSLSGLASQGYAIRRVVDGSATNWWVIGQDAPGAMYGGLELAEAVKLADGLAGATSRQTNPYLANRGIKFNIPLDARSPSYSDGPSVIEGAGEFPPADAAWNTCTKYRINLKYPNNIEVVLAGGYPDIKGGTKWIGTDGWVHVTRSAFSASNEAWTEMASLPDDLRKVKLYESPGHQRNFLDCVKSRKPTITPVETAHHSTVPGHLGLIAMMTGRKIKWDVRREVILADTEASKLLGREYRKPWSLG